MMASPDGEAEQPYFSQFLHVLPPELAPMRKVQERIWQICAGLTAGLGIWYLQWRWAQSLNPEAMVFSSVMALAETLAFLGTLLFYFDIWEERDTPMRPPPQSRKSADLDGFGAISVDILITTFDEAPNVVAPSIEAAKSVLCPQNVQSHVFLLDDGDRESMRKLAARMGVNYLSRTQNRGFKAGNLANALFKTDGDFVVICDADTQLFKGFLQHTLGYFRDPKIAWVQTPHWFYDLENGRDWAQVCRAHLGALWRPVTWVLTRITGRARICDDQFLADGLLFFDVIQRRRNRNGASFCCGAGSIHRREAIFDSALSEHGRLLSGATRHAKNSAAPETARHLLPRLDFQPFRFHVSEDLFTSTQQHANGWRSVYHPHVEARMLSPWSTKAWAMQKLKYAGGTFDIFLSANPLRRTDMPLRMKLHYAATFWSYLSIFWLPILFFAPVVSLLFGISPVQSYSIDFFRHLLPVLVVNEIALVVGAKGHNVWAGRILSVGTLNIQWRAFLQVLRGDKPHFPPTPKTPTATLARRHAVPHLVLLWVLVFSAGWGIWRSVGGTAGYDAGFLAVNLLWILWNCGTVLRMCCLTLLKPQLPKIHFDPNSEDQNAAQV